MQLKDLKRVLADCDLTQYLDRIEAHHLPCVWLQLGEQNEDAIGCSHLFGDPDLPADMAWPHTSHGQAMTFLLQINLADVLQAEGVWLPRTGLLSVFVVPPDGMADLEHKVMVIPAGQQILRRQSPVTEETDAYDPFARRPSYRLMFSMGADFPRWATDDYSALCDDMDEETRQLYEEEFTWALEPPKGAPVVGKLLGHVSGIGHDPRKDATFKRDVSPDLRADSKNRWKLDLSEAHCWKHLLQIDSVMAIDLTICDAGYLQFLGREEQLKAGDFSNLYAQIESS